MARCVGGGGGYGERERKRDWRAGFRVFVVVVVVAVVAVADGGDDCEPETRRDEAEDEAEDDEVWGLERADLLCDEEEEEDEDCILEGGTSTRTLNSSNLGRSDILPGACCDIFSDSLCFARGGPFTEGAFFFP